MKALTLLILSLLVGCGGVDEPVLISEILDNYEMAFTQGYIWATATVINGGMLSVGDAGRKLDSIGYKKQLYRDGFIQGAYHCFNYAATKINTRDEWLRNRINFLIDSLRIK